MCCRLCLLAICTVTLGWNDFITLLIWNQNSDSHLKKKIFRFLSRFVHVRLQSWHKMLIWPKNIFSQRRIWLRSQIPWEKCKKIYSKNFLAFKCRQEIMYFLYFSTVYKSSQPSNFLRVNFLATFSTDSLSASSSRFFDTHTDNICGK